MSFFSQLGKVGHGIKVAAVAVEHGGIYAVKFAAPIAIPIVTHGLVTQEAVAEVLKLSAGKDASENMNPLEMMGITLILGTLQSVVKNPAHKAALENQLLAVADDIYFAYGIQPPAHASATSNAAPSV